MIAALWQPAWNVTATGERIILVIDQSASMGATDGAPTRLDSAKRSARDIIEKFGFEVHIDRLDKANLLFLVLSRFCDIDLHPEAVSNLEMGYLYEELIRRFADL